MALRERIEKPCEHCGEPFVAKERRYRFCSLSCGNSKREKGTGVVSRNADGRGYFVCRDGSQILYSRALMAGELRRLPRRQEIVHHRNGDPSDDRLENLRIVTASEHALLHGFGKWSKR